MTTFWEIIHKNTNEISPNKQDVDDISTIVNFKDVIDKLQNNKRSDISILSYKLEQIWKSLNDANSTEVNKYLFLLSKSDKYEEISKYVDELDIIAKIYEEKKKKVQKKASENWTELSEEVLNAPEIENPREFIKELLEANNWWMNRISSSIEEANSLSEQDLVDKIKGTFVYFDVEPEDWDIYFKENNISKEKQDQFKKYYSKLQWEKVYWLDPISSNGHDFWNISVINDFWDDISQEAERILNLSDGVIITLSESLDDLNPSDGKIEFKTKKDALLYLYYNKLLFKEVWTFIEDIKQGWLNLGSWALAILNFVKENPWEIFYTIAWYMVISRVLTWARHINAWVVRESSWTIWFWEYLNEAWPWADWAHNIEWKELDRREKLIENLKSEFAWNPEKLDKIDILQEKYLHVLDHNIDKDKDQRKSLREIEKNILEIKKQIKDKELSKSEAKEVLDWLNRDKKILSRKLFRRPLQWTFDSEVSYIRWTKSRKIDYYGKWILFSTESENKWWAKRQKEFKDKIQKEFFSERNWEIIKSKFLNSLEQYIELSHDIWNKWELELKNIFQDYIENLSKWDFNLPKWITHSNYKNLMKRKILSDLKSKWLNIDKDFEKKLARLKDVQKNIWIRSIEDINKLDRKIKADFPWIEWERLIQIRAFYSEIILWDNRYDIRTASDIASRILRWLDLDDAIKESFSIKSEIIEKIKIKSSSFALTALDLANNDFIELNDVTRRVEVEDILEENNEKRTLREKWKGVKEKLSPLTDFDTKDIEFEQKSSGVKEVIKNFIETQSTDSQEKRESTKYQEKESSFEQRNAEIIELATNNQTEYTKLVQKTTEKLELRVILDWGKASEVSFTWVDNILEVEWNYKYNEWLLKDFADKINVEWIDYKAVELALENSSEKGKMTRRINEAWKTELKEFWKRAKKLWKEFFKEVKKGKI